MKIVVPSRHGRLLLLCALSAGLHLLFLELIARHGAPSPAPLPGGSGPLLLRLAPLRAGRSPVAVGAGPASPSSADAAAGAAAAAAASARPAGATRAAPQTATQTAIQAAAAAADVSTAAGAGPATPGDAALQMPARYRVRMPPPVSLVYTLTRRDAAGRAGPAGQARLDWRNDGASYTLEIDGVLGRLGSSGIAGDAGIQPQRAAEALGDAQRVTAFDADGRRVLYPDGSAGPDAPGIQDRASLLMQLAGIGLARPEQVADVIEIVVAEERGARIERFQVMGEEDLDTGAGRLRAWRLAELAPAGTARLEVWLAPDQGWLPVQLRLSAPDGTSATQVLAAPPAPAAP